MVLAVLEVSDRLAVVVPKGTVEDEVKETGEEWMHIYCEFEDNPQEHTHKYIYIYIFTCVAYIHLLWMPAVILVSIEGAFWPWEAVEVYRSPIKNMEITDRVNTYIKLAVYRNTIRRKMDKEEGVAIDKQIHTKE